MHVVGVKEGRMQIAGRWGLTALGRRSKPPARRVADAPMEIRRFATPRSAGLARPMGRLHFRVFVSGVVSWETELLRVAGPQAGLITSGFKVLTAT